MGDFSPADLPRISDRIPYLYLEQCTVERHGNALTATSDDETINIPAATLGILMLGPGTSTTHAAISLICEVGATILWVGEHGVRCYASGSALTGSTRMLERQAQLVSNPRTRLTVARKMYQIRFPDEDLSRTTMRQLLGMEGKRVADIYRKEAQRVGIRWEGRRCNPDANTVNLALSVANSCLYGVVHAAVEALGLSPALGFVHCHNRRSFVFDIADLYKAEVTIPVAFDLHGCPAGEVTGVTRRMIRDRISDGKLIARCVEDIEKLLAESPDTEEPEACGIWAGGDTYGKAGTRWQPSSSDSKKHPLP